MGGFVGLLNASDHESTGRNIERSISSRTGAVCTYGMGDLFKCESLWDAL